MSDQGALGFPGDSRPPARRRRGRAPRSKLRSLVEWVVVIGGAVVVSLAVRTYLFQAFYIPSESMVPTLEVGDRVVVDKRTDQVEDLDRGDLVVFGRPEGEPTTAEDLIKRVIGLPGETVAGRDGVVWVDGAPLEEPWLDAAVRTSDFAPVTVPPDAIWVMGDNRGDSRDSRVFGPVPGSLVVGEAVWRIWPLDRLGGL